MGLDPGEADDDEQAYFRGSLASQSGKQADIYNDKDFLKKMRVIQLKRQGVPLGRAMARANEEDLETLQQAYAGYKRKQAKGPGPDPDPDPTPIDNCGWYRKALETMIACKVCLIPRGFFQAHSCPDDYPKLKKVVDLQLDVMELKAGRDFRSYPQMIAKIKERCAAEQCPDIPPEPGPKPGPKKTRKARTRMGSDPGSKGGMRMGDITAPDIRDNADEEDFNAFSDLGKFFKGAQKRGSLFEDMTSDQQKALAKLVAKRLKEAQYSSGDPRSDQDQGGPKPRVRGTHQQKLRRSFKPNATFLAYRDMGHMLTKMGHKDPQLRTPKGRIAYINNLLAKAGMSYAKGHWKGYRGMKKVLRSIAGSGRKTMKPSELKPGTETDATKTHRAHMKDLGIDTLLDP